MAAMSNTSTCSCGVQSSAGSVGQTNQHLPYAHYIPQAQDGAVTVLCTVLPEDAWWIVEQTVTSRVHPLHKTQWTIVYPPHRASRSIFLQSV